METRTEKRIRLTEELKQEFYDPEKGWKGKDWTEYDSKLGDEQWRTIERFPNILFSNYGIIKNKGSNKTYGCLKLLKDHHKTLYFSSGLKYKHYLNHRLIAEAWFPDFDPNANPRQQIDHIDGNGINNKINNLRLSTNQQNSCNQRLPKNNTSGFKGVGIEKKTGHFYADLRYKGESIRIGTYDTAEEAGRAYDKKAIELFGEFACTNKSLGLLD